MCGIVGALSFTDDFFITEAYLTRMRDTMTHRGPDGAGVWVEEGGRVGLGHRRLSIIDLSDTAGQPMPNEDQTLWAAFNGEIYNHAGIRAELERIGGHRWRTDHSDTEVIIHAFEEWGINCLARFRGMFAIAIWDARRRELWLVRDRIGKKPLYYSIHHHRITFASEIKALLEDPEQARSLREESFYDYLSFLTTPAPYTLFEGIRKLPGGVWLKARVDGQVSTCRYWDVWANTRPLAGVSEDEAAEALLQELRAAVKLRKVSDVPVGVFLSGGLDSSTNTALFSEGESQAVKTFTIGYQGEYRTYPNELEYARRMAKIVGADHHELLLTVDDLISFLPKMARLQDEPIADPVCVPVYYVSKLARDHGVIVCQVGEGADELFWGYPSWKVKLRLQQYNDLPIPKALKQVGLFGLRGFGKEQSLYYELLRRATSGIPVFWGGAEAFTEAQKKRLLGPRLREKFARRSSWDTLEPIYNDFRDSAWEPSHLNWMSYLDLRLRLPELLLMRVDKMSMGVSLECRAPFLDHKFVELAMSIPAALKAKNGELKYLLKKAVRHLIPDELTGRKKQGFGVPIYEWFFERLDGEIRRELNDFCRQSDLLDHQEVQKLMDRGQGPKLWYLLNFVLWWKEYL
ncbi:MAG: asparagine synthase (glutamine-hydrolyzing) [Firmicutes bacterium]|nr:asparagine synthase (glutamine-hydrolyzing) [Bacillota bacterium]